MRVRGKAFAEGMAMSAEEAAEYALSEEIVPAPRDRQPAGKRTIHSLLIPLPPGNVKWRLW